MSETKAAELAAMRASMAQAVKMARFEEQWSRRKLAEESGLSERLIVDVENGAANPSLDSMAALADALGLRVWEMLAGAWHPAPRLAQLVAGLSVHDQDRIADLIEAQRRRARATGVRVVLVGLRGAGKTTVGKLLAKRLKSDFVELDRRVEERAGLPLAQLFEIHGEPYYRRLEYEILKEVLASPGASVIEAGGGLVSHAESWALAKQAASTVWLRAKPEEYLSRVLAQGDRRPVERRPQALSELKALLAAREPSYAEAALTLDTSGQAPARLVERIAEFVAKPESLAR